MPRCSCARMFGFSGRLKSWGAGGVGRLFSKAEREREREPQTRGELRKDEFLVFPGFLFLPFSPSPPPLASQGFGCPAAMRPPKLRSDLMEEEKELLGPKGKKHTLKTNREAVH